MFIRSLTLRNILSFRDTAPLELKPLNILIGPNGSGKSNLIDSIQVLQALPNSMVNFINQRGGTEAWVWKGSKRTGDAARITCQFEIENNGLEYEIAFSAVDLTLAIQAESLRSVQNANRRLVYLERSGSSLRIGDNGLQTKNDRVSMAPAESALEVYRNPLDPTPVTRSARAFSGIRIYRDFKTGVEGYARRGASAADP